MGQGKLLTRSCLFSTGAIQSKLKHRLSELPVCLGKLQILASTILLAWCLGIIGSLSSQLVMAASGPLGIDHKLSYDNSGIWKRSNQLALLELMIVGEIAGGIWEGGETRLGRTFWQSIDSSALAGISAQVLKYTFRRARPGQTDNPNEWFQSGTQYNSFPSGEVAAMNAIVTPFVLEYRQEYPAVYALELLPIYDGIARMKVQGHWQTDVLAGFALGGLTGYYVHKMDNPFVLGILPHGFTIGLKKQF